MADVFDTLTPDKPQAAAGDVFDQVSPQPGTSVNKSTPGDVFDTVEHQEDKADPFRAAGQATSLSAGPNIHAWDALKSGEFMEFYNRAKNWLSAAGEDVANGTNQTALGSLLKSMGSHGTLEAQRFSQDMRDEVLGTTPKTPTQRVMRSIGKTAAGAVLSPLDWVPDVLQGTSRAVKAVPGVLEATGAAAEGDESKAFHSTTGAFNDLVGGGFQALTPIISVMYPAALAERGLAAVGPELAKTGATLASAMGMQFAGQVIAADMGADPDVQEAVGNVFGLATFKAFHTLFGPTDFEKFGHQFNDYTNAEAAYRSSAQELSVQREQVRAAQAAVDEAVAAERAGTGNRAQTVAARQAASEASASALKAQRKFELASDARAKAKVEIDKTTNRIERAMEKERQKAKGRSSDVAQVATDSWNKFSRAIRSSGTRQFDQNDYEVWRNYAEPHHENVDPIMSVKDVAESAEVEREQLENDARSKVHGEDYKDQPLQTDIEAGNQALDHVRRSLAERDNVQPGFADRAVSYLQEKFNTTDLTLAEADRLRAEINRLNRAKLKESGWNVSDAMASDSNFAAREALNDYLKETIEQRLQDLGVDGVRENRMDQASLVRIRNAAEGMLSSNSRAGEVMVRGTGENSRGRRAVSWLVKRFAQGGGAALGAELGGPGGAAFGAASGGMLSEPILEKILRPNLTRDQLIQSIMQDKNGNPIKVATGSPARITAGVAPGAPPAAPMPPVPPEPAPYEARDKDLHGDMMTYFDKRPGQDGSSYPELVQMVKDEMDIYQKHGVKAADRPQTLNDLANRITKEELAEDLERAKEARDRAAKKAEKAATVESVAQEATGKAADEVTPADKAKLATEQAAAAAAIPVWDWKQLFPFKYSDTELEVPQELWGNKSFDPFYTRIHELAHHIANLKLGAPPIDVLSHIGTKGESWASARADISRFENEDGSTNMDAVRANMGDLLTRFAIGGVAEQIHGGARFDENSTLSTDLINAKDMLNALDIPEARQHELLREAIRQAHEWLTEKGVKELMETYARKRIADTPDTHHFTKEHIKAFSNALGELVGGDYEPDDTDGGKKTSGKGLERVQSEAGEGREGAASRREGQAAQDLDVRKSVPEAKVGKAEKGLVERTTGSEAEDRAIKAGGGIPAGTVDMGGKIRMFHDPETGTTLGIREGEELTPEAVRKQIEESRAKYAAGEARQKLGTEKATPAESLSDRLVETYGTTDDPHSAAFILNDGRMVPLHNTHNDMLDTLYRKYGDIGINEAERTAFINDEGAVRTRLRTGRGGSEVVFSVPKDGVKPEQVEQIKKSVGKLRNGNVVMEVADENGRGASAKKEFARVSDVEPMLREIGAAPKIGLETEQAISPKEADENYKKYLEAQKAAEEKEAENKKSFKLETGIAKAAQVPYEKFKDELDTRKYTVKPIGETSPDYVYNHSTYLLGDGSALSSHEYLSNESLVDGQGKDLIEHHHIASDIGADKLKKVNAIRIGGPNNFEISARPTEQQLREIVRIFKESGRSNLVWDLRKKNGELINASQGSIGDFRRAIDAAYKPFPSLAVAKAAPETAPHVVEGANRYNKSQGRAEVNPETQPHDPEFAKRVADAYDAMKHNPNDPAVKKSYEAMKNEVRQQWDHAVNDMGMKFEPWTKEGQPYANSKEMVKDVRDNKHLYFFTGGDIKADSPMAKVDPETGLSYNDMFRAVHDLFGHAAHGNEFGPKGEEKAYQLHRQMFSPEAVPALTSETRGQNSWVNFGKHMRNAEGNIPAKGEPGFVPQTQRPYAEQKVGLLPEEFHAAAAKKFDEKNILREPTTSSKQKYENQPPLTVYHGTAGDFNTFETERKTVNDWNLVGPLETKRHAIFFSENPEFAKTFAKAKGGKRVVSANLSVKNPFEMDNQSLSDYLGETAAKYDEARKTGSESDVAEAKREYTRANWLYNLRDKWEVFDGPEGKEFVDDLKKRGYDGAHFEEEGHGLGDKAPAQSTWAVFDPHQIRILPEGAGSTTAKGDWAEKVVGNLAKESAGGINPNNPEEPSKRYGLEFIPEARNAMEARPTAEDFRAYAERPEVKQALASHPDIKLGWDVGGEKPELNVGVSTDDKAAALDVAKKLDQRAMWDNEKKEEIPVGGEGKKTAFPDYPLEQRLKDLNLKTEKAYPKDEDDNPDWEKLTPEQMSQAVKDSAYATYSLDEVKDGSPWLSGVDKEEGKIPAISADHGSEAGFLHPDGSMSMIGDSFLHDVFSKEIGLENSDLVKKAGIGTYDIWSAPHSDHTGIAFDLAAPPTPEQIQAIAALTKHMREGEPETFQSVHVTWPGGEKGIEFPTPGKVIRELKGINLGTEKAAPEQHPDIVSTAVPFGKSAIADPHAEHVRIDMNSIPEKPMAKIAARVREVPGIKVPENIKDPTKVVNRYIDQAKDNLKYLYNKVPAETRNQNAQWYESANNIADRISNEHGKTTRQGAGVIAAMSPQKDWNMNVGLAERLMNIYHEQAGESLTPEARTKAKEIGMSGMAARIGDRKLSELSDQLEKAAFIRIWDEAHNDRSFYDVDPATGNYRDVVKTDAGEPYRIAWGSLNEIAKAVSILEDGSRENISRVLGMGHKVRNFYNNIIDPNNPGGHVTVDTHAVAAAQMRPLSGKDPETLFHFGRLSAAQTGLKGMYPVHAEAYRQAAAELGTQPRQLQSVVWEEARRLFSADLKSDPDAREAIDNVWKDYEKGKLSLNEARDAVYNTAKQYNDKIAQDKAAGKRRTSFGFTSPSSFANISGSSGPVMEGATEALRGLNLKTEQSLPPQSTWDAFGPKQAPGLVTRGNINLNNRPVIKNADGSHSSEYSTSFQDEDGEEVLVPTVVNGRFLTPDGKKPAPGSAAEKAMFKAAWDHYKKTGQHMGKFDTPEHADAYAAAVHNRKQ